MLELLTKTLELRGIKNETSAKGNVYYMIYTEDEGGQPYKFFCKNYSAIPQGLKKGDNVRLTLAYNHFKELQVLKVEKVNE